MFASSGATPPSCQHVPMQWLHQPGDTFTLEPPTPSNSSTRLPACQAVAEATAARGSATASEALRVKLEADLVGLKTWLRAMEDTERQYVAVLRWGPRRAGLLRSKGDGRCYVSSQAIIWWCRKGSCCDGAASCEQRTQLH
jgi:hypothetical protein